MLNTTTQQIDWEERKTAELLAAARKSGFFKCVIDDAKYFASEGYSWVCALKISCDYWCS